MIRDVCYILHVYHQLTKFFYVQWFGENFVHATIDGFIDVLVFNVAGDGDNLGLVL
jgi:hypothetical protein